MKDLIAVIVSNDIKLIGSVFFVALLFNTRKIYSFLCVVRIQQIRELLEILDSGQLSKNEIPLVKAKLTDLTFSRMHRIFIRSTEHRIAITNLVEDSNGVIGYSDFSRARAYIPFIGGKVTTDISLTDKMFRQFSFVFGPLLILLSVPVLVTFGLSFGDSDGIEWNLLCSAISSILGAFLIIKIASNISTALRVAEYFESLLKAKKYS